MTLKRHKMKSRVLAFWLGLIGVFTIFFNVLPHHEVHIAHHAYNAILALLFFISLFLFLKEPTRRTKFVFLNFTLFFSISLLFSLSPFVGRTIFSSAPFALHYYQVAAVSFYIFFYSLAIVYVVINLLFNDFKIYQKYLSTFGVVAFFFVFYFHPFFENPLYLYSTEDIKQYKSTYESWSAFQQQNGRTPSIEELAATTTLTMWQDGVAIGELYHDQKIARIAQLAPYLEGDNYRVLIWKPMYQNIIYMNIMMMGFILLFFGYQYKKDPPQGAYVDKIMYALFMLLSADVLHHWSLIKSVEWTAFKDIIGIGQYITLGILMLVVLFFSLRLKFITSVQGEFYESELATNPQLITRWRDGIDNFVLRYFFNIKPFNGRLFEKRV